MMGVSIIPLDYVVRRAKPVGWVASNDHDRLKYQALHAGPLYETDCMTVYGELKSCCLNSQGCPCIKWYDNQKDGRLYMVSLRDHYKGAGEANKISDW